MTETKANALLQRAKELRAEAKTLTDPHGIAAREALADELTAQAEDILARRPPAK